MTTTRFIISGWTWHCADLLIGAALILGYLAAFGVQGRIGYFAAALGVFALTTMSPIARLAEGYLFSAHMAQHILLLIVVPALLLVGLPRSVSLSIRARVVEQPVVGWASGVGAMWLWHAPVLCNAAGSSKLIAGIQTLSLLVLGLGFWRQILAPREEERLSPPQAIFYLFSACIACSLLGIILTLSPVTVCSIYSMPRPDPQGLLSMIRSEWGVTPERDQQIGGLLMWVPMCLIYLGAIFSQVVRWFAQPASPIGREVQ